MATSRTRRPRDAWAHTELDRVIAEARRGGTWSDEATVRVSDPACREELIACIRDRIWPGILAIFHATELMPDATGKDGHPEIHQEWAPETTVSFVFLVASTEDTGMDIGDDPYFCRITTKVRPRGYMFETDFYIHFPESFDMDRLKSLLGNPKFVGNPPKLIYEVRHDDSPGMLIVEFNFGRGHEYPVLLPIETMLADMAEHVNFLRRLIRAVRKLSRDYDSEPFFRKVVNELEKCFQAE